MYKDGLSKSKYKQKMKDFWKKMWRIRSIDEWYRRATGGEMQSGDSAVLNHFQYHAAGIKPFYGESQQKLALGELNQAL